MWSRREFPHSQRSVADSRRFVRDAVGDLPTEMRDAIALMTSELATNALVHTDGGFQMTIERTEERLQVSVADRSEQLPSLLAPEPSEIHGRGIRIVRDLSDAWGSSDESGEGKIVWFQVNLASGTVFDRGRASTGRSAIST
jgi:anti-sigma regulatory factor (Ser/Thr protein kinase)